MSKKFRDAEALFEAFHHRAPIKGDVEMIAVEPGEVTLYVGELVGVLYKAGGEEYIHKFKSNDRPDLFVSADGQQAYIVAGRYVFTERGFVD